MTKEALIKKTINVLEKLPKDKVNEVASYAKDILKKYEEKIIQRGIEKLVSESRSFDFLKKEEDIYTVNDLRSRKS